MSRSIVPRRLVFALALAAGLACGPAALANSQQDKMTSCNAEASSKQLSGDARKSFMSTCLSNKPAAAPKGNSQQEKMKSCNAEASGKQLKGDARKSFMSSCLSN